MSVQNKFRKVVIREVDFPIYAEAMRILALAERVPELPIIGLKLCEAKTPHEFAAALYAFRSKEGVLATLPPELRERSLYAQGNAIYEDVYRRVCLEQKTNVHLRPTVTIMRQDLIQATDIQRRLATGTVDIGHGAQYAMPMSDKARSDAAKERKDRGYVHTVRTIRQKPREFEDKVLNSLERTMRRFSK